MVANTSLALQILNEKIDELTFSPEERHLYESRMKLKSDIATIYESSFNKGLEKGIERGIEKGIKKGRTEGSHNAKLETAKRLLDMGLSIADVAKATMLEEEEISNL